MTHDEVQNIETQDDVDSLKIEDIKEVADEEEEEEELQLKEKEEDEEEKQEFNEEQKFIAKFLDINTGVQFRESSETWKSNIEKVVKWYNSNKIDGKEDWKVNGIEDHLKKYKLIGKEGLITDEKGNDIISLKNMKKIKLKRKRVIVVAGGGYFGREYARHAVKKKGIKVIMINPSEYFDLRTATPFIIADKHKDYRYSKKLVDYIPNKFKNQFTLIKDKLVECTNEGILRTEGGKNMVRGVDYDILVAATGSMYSTERLNIQDNVNIPVGLANHVQHLRPYDRFFGDNIKSITVVGGGPTGVEVTGTLLAAFPKKTIIHICGRKEYLDRANIKGAHKLISKQFNKYKNYQPHMGQYVTGIHDNTIDMTNGSLQTDCVIVSNGFTPITEYLPKDALADRGLVDVNLKLQSKTYPWLFAGGDILSIKEEKTAAAAHAHSKLAIKNTYGYLTNQSMKDYKIKPMGSIIMYGPKYAMLATSSSVTMANRLIRYTKLKLQDIFMK